MMPIRPQNLNLFSSVFLAVTIFQMHKENVRAFAAKEKAAQNIIIIVAHSKFIFS